MKTNNQRNYEIQMIEGDQEFSSRKLTIDRLLSPKENDWEYIYALNDEIDKVLDLKRGESMYFNPNRDSENTKGIILRVN